MLFTSLFLQLNLYFITDAGVNPWLWAAIPLVAGGIIAAASNHDSDDDSSAPVDTTPPSTDGVTFSVDPVTSIM